MSDSHREIERLLYLYAERIDAGDFEGVGELLAHATLVSPDGRPGPQGREAITQLYERTTRRYEADGTPRTQHVITNVIVDVDEAAGQAEARSRFTVLQAVDALGLQPVVAGRYRDRFERVDGQWRFCERCMMPELLGDLSHHLLVDLPPR